jgi:putative cytotoxic protein
MVPAPRRLSAFPSAERVTPKSGRHRWFDGRNGYIYEWDYQHGRVERYDRRGRHLGEFDPQTGAMTKPANREQTIEP